MQPGRKKFQQTDIVRTVLVSELIRAVEVTWVRAGRRNRGGRDTKTLTTACRKALDKLRAEEVAAEAEAPPPDEAKENNSEDEDEEYSDDESDHLDYSEDDDDEDEASMQHARAAMPAAARSRTAATHTLYHARGARVHDNMRLLYASKFCDCLDSHGFCCAYVKITLVSCGGVLAGELKMSNFEFSKIKNRPKNQFS
jgi:hypothetical protein